MQLQKSGFQLDINLFTLEELEWVAELKSAIEENEIEKIKQKTRGK